jgi:hypothetical protein
LRRTSVRIRVTDALKDSDGVVRGEHVLFGDSQFPSVNLFESLFGNRHGTEKPTIPASLDYRRESVTTRHCEQSQLTGSRLPFQALQHRDRVGGGQPLHFVHGFSPWTAACRATSNHEHVAQHYDSA